MKDSVDWAAWARSGDNTMPVSPDADTANADWTKQTDDTQTLRTREEEIPDAEVTPKSASVDIGNSGSNVMLCREGWWTDGRGKRVAVVRTEEVIEGGGVTAGAWKRK